MRLAFLVGVFPALSETFILNQITGLLERGVDLDIIALHQGDTTRMHEAVIQHGLLNRTFYTTPFSRWLSLRFVCCAIFLFEILFRRGLKVFSNTLRWCIQPNRTPLPRSILLFVAHTFLTRGDYDVVHGHFGQYGQVLTELREIGILRGKVFATFYGGDVLMATRQYGTDCYSTLFQKGDRVLAISAFMKSQLIDFGCPPEKLQIHHLGIDCAHFHRKRPRQSENSSIRLLSISRLVEKKGLEYAIRAFGLIAPDSPTCHYDIIGDGPLEPSLMQLVQELNLQDQVRFLGSMTQDKILEILETVDLFILPSVTSSDGDQEGTPTVLIEALAMELPVLSTRHAGVPEVVPDSQAGYLVEERDFVGLSARLSELVADPAQRKSMGEFGRQHVLKEFDSNKLNDWLLNAYKESLNFR